MIGALFSVIVMAMYYLLVHDIWVSFVDAEVEEVGAYMFALGSVKEAGFDGLMIASADSEVKSQKS